VRLRRRRELLSHLTKTIRMTKGPESSVKGLLRRKAIKLNMFALRVKADISDPLPNVR
jgi:hypothetical protein